MVEAREVETEAGKKVKDLEYKIKNAKQLKEKELKEADVDVKKCKKAKEAAKAKWTDQEDEEARLKLEIQELKKSIAEAMEQLNACDEALEGMANSLKALIEELAEGREAAKAAKDAVKAQKDAVAKNNKEINAQHAKIEKISKENKEKELGIQEMNHKMSKAAEEAKDAKHTVQAMVKKYEWISVDRKFFGEPGSAYDFNATNPKDAAKRVHKLEENKASYGFLFLMDLSQLWFDYYFVFRRS